jgi:hypothetical protein
MSAYAELISQNRHKYGMATDTTRMSERNPDELLGGIIYTNIPPTERIDRRTTGLRGQPPLSAR